MPKLDAKAAAAAIRDQWTKEPPPVSAEEQHVQAYLTDVCKELGVEPTPINIAHASQLLAKAGVERHKPNEFPKAYNKKDDMGRIVPVVWPDGHPSAGLPVVFESEQDETAYEAKFGSPTERPAAA